MMKKLVYTPEAVRQLKSVKAYISDTLQNPKAADNIVRKITAGCRLLVEFPDMGRSVNLIDDGTPVRLLILDNHIIIYDVTGDAVRIISVEDARSDWAQYFIRQQTENRRLKRKDGGLVPSCFHSMHSGIQTVCNLRYAAHRCL